MPIKVMKENRLEDTMGIFDKLKQIVNNKSNILRRKYNARK